MNLYVLISGTTEGPFSIKEIERMFNERKLSINSLCWHEGLVNWVSISELEFFRQKVPPPPPKAFHKTHEINNVNLQPLKIAQTGASPKWPWVCAIISGALLICSLQEGNKLRIGLDNVSSKLSYVDSQGYAERRSAEILNSDNPDGELAKETIQRGILSFGHKIVSDGIHIIDQSTIFFLWLTIIFSAIGIYNLFQSGNSVNIPRALGVGLAKGMYQFDKLKESINSPHITSTLNNGINKGFGEINKINERLQSVEKTIDNAMLVGSELNYPAKIWAISIGIALLGKMLAVNGLLSWNACMAPFGFYAWSTNKELMTILNLKKLSEDANQPRFGYLVESLKHNLSYPPFLLAVVGSIIVLMGQISGLISGDSLWAVLNSPDYTSKNFWVGPFLGAALFRILIKALNLKEQTKP